MPAFAAAARNRRRKKVYDAFRGAGATSPEKAKPLAEVGVEGDREAEGLIRAEVIRPIGGDRYYLDETALGDFLSNERRVAILIAALMVAIVGALIVFLKG